MSSSIVARTGRQLQRYDNNLRLVSGCIPYRLAETKDQNRIEVLMVSSPNRDDMVFPKGGWESDETVEEAACREALEEAGVRGNLKGNPLGVWEFRSKSKEAACTKEGGCKGYMFALEVTEELEAWPEQKNRSRKWILPLENLRHVKRVRKQHTDGGSTQLSVILCLAGENDSQLDSIPQEVVELIDSHQLETFITKVCKYAPLSKEEWEEQCKRWPTSFHPPTYNISGITGFSEEEAHSVYTFMKLALDLAKCESQMGNAAVVVDPSTNEVIASACDQVHSCSCSINHEITTSSSLAYRFQNHDNVQNSSATRPQVLYDRVSCLNPWQWSNQKLCDDSCSWHPLRHAAIVAIEYSAARDRHLFPGSGHDLAETDHVDSNLTCHSSKKQKTKSDHVKDDEEDNLILTGCPSELARPYLCTGYDIYLMWEPCTMCAMALVHQRVKRIFYAFPNPNAGALGSVHRLQGEKSLNHHYAVFKVWLPEDSLDRGGIPLVSKSIDSDNTENLSNVAL